MGRIRVPAFVALPTLALLTSTALAQAPRPERATPSMQDKKTIETCQASGGGSRVRSACEPEPATVRTEQTFKMSIELPPLSTARCETTATTEYQQRNTVARVSGTLKLADCAAASGEFTVAVRVRDESGEIKPLEFMETWRRDDDQDVKFAEDYPIGDDVELVNVRVRDMRCTCAEPPREEVPP